MWDNLIVYHSDRVKNAPPKSSFLLWETCQRCIYIGDHRLTHKPWQTTEFELFKGYAAYKFLLAVITGLKSSLFAETEIMHQFKTHFNKDNLPRSAFGDYLHKLLNDLLVDGKFLRRNYLMNLGDQSYGGVAHRLLPQRSRVLVIGSGQLAQKVIPFIKKGDRNVVLAARNEAKREELSLANQIDAVELQNIDQVPFDCIVICAPLSLRDLKLAIQPDAMIVDLRADAKNDGLEVYKNYHSFASILYTLDKTRDRHQLLQKKLDKVMDELVHDRRMARVEFVHGWEDIPCLAG